MVVNVWISAVTTDTLSRKEAVAWVNDTLKSHLTKVEELSTGAAYCQMTHYLFPESINLRKIKFNPRNEPDILNNWKVLTTSWKTLGIDKPVDVEKLKKGKFQDNMEFLQWFYKFFNANIGGEIREYDAVAARGGEDLPALKGPGGAAKPALSRPAAPISKPAPVSRPVRPAGNGTLNTTTTTTTAPRPVTSAAKPVASQSDALLKKENQELRANLAEKNEELNALFESSKEMEGERDHYYGMLRALEELMTEMGENGATSIPISEIKKVLYAEDDENTGEADANDVVELKANGTVQANVSDLIEDPETF